MRKGYFESVKVLYLNKKKKSCKAKRSPVNSIKSI